MNGETMRGKLVLLLGFGIGYLLGARAGRGRYEQIKRTFKGFWEDPRVKQQVQVVEDFAREKAPEVVDFLGDTAKKVIKRKSPTASESKSTTTKK
ncbi:MAG: YtxH domain-containing protein [Microbacteriaceae bacterium]|nr:hypothetical protein [Cryobacterium sp.]MCC6376150.1 YtxH domain-containing protein [Microbacteriaceae bacterium]